MSEQPGTREYFLSEVRAFFELCGTVEFWALSLKQQQGAADGLAYVYFNSEHGEHLESDAKMFEMALCNYSRRAILVDFMNREAKVAP